MLTVLACDIQQSYLEHATGLPFIKLVINVMPVALQKYQSAVVVEMGFHYEANASLKWRKYCTFSPISPIIVSQTTIAKLFIFFWYGVSGRLPTLNVVQSHLTIGIFTVGG